MATMTPTRTITYNSGGRTQPLDTVTVLPERARLPEDFVGFADGQLNPPFIADFLSAALIHEQCGRYLYRSVGARTINPILKSRYGKFEAETEEHIRLIQELIENLGGDPQYVSPAARATEKMNSATLEATIMIEGSVDVMTAELKMLEAVILAETMDRGNWAFIEQLGNEMPIGKPRDAVLMAAAQVRPQEDEHLMWALETRKRMLRMQATNPLLARVAATAEETIAYVRDLFAGDPR